MTPVSIAADTQPAALPYADAERLEPLVRRVLARNPSPFTYTGTESYIVGAGSEVAVIDPGPDDTEHIDALLAGIGAAKLVAIVCTHTHRDHSPAAAPLARLTGAPIVGCAPLSLADDGPRADASFDTTYRPDHVLEDGEQVSGEGWTLTAVATPGHTSNHLCYALGESGALFTGDHVMGWSTSVVSPPDGDMTAYMASLAKLQGRDDRVYYPAHGPAVEKPQQLVRGMIGHRRQRENQILRLLGAGSATIPTLVPQMYAGVDQRLYPGRRSLGAGAPHRPRTPRPRAPRGRRKRDMDDPSVTRDASAPASVPHASRNPARQAALPWLLFIAALALAAWLAWRAFHHDPQGDVLAASLTTFEKQDKLTVFSAELSPVVGSDASQLFGMLKSRQVAVIPARIDYTLDLSKIGRDRMTWNADTKRLDVRLPALTLGRPNLDEARAQYLREGVWITAGAQEQLNRANTQLAEKQAAASAASPVLMGLARTAAKEAVEQNLAVPLKVAGYGDVTVAVRFDGEPVPQ